MHTFIAFGNLGLYFLKLPIFPYLNITTVKGYRKYPGHGYLQEKNLL